MPAYYNEFDPKAAAWLRDLMKGGHIPEGEVDERSIADVRPADLAGFTQCHFLNPDFSRWLMGYPAVWGSCGVTAMPSSRRSPRRSSKRTPMLSLEEMLA